VAIRTSTCGCVRNDARAATRDVHFWGAATAHAASCALAVVPGARDAPRVAGQSTASFRGAQIAIPMPMKTSPTVEKTGKSDALRRRDSIFRHLPACYGLAGHPSPPRSARIGGARER
jgi:hypothetical protein